MIDWAGFLGGMIAGQIGLVLTLALFKGADGKEERDQQDADVEMFAHALTFEGHDVLSGLDSFKRQVMSHIIRDARQKLMTISVTHGDSVSLSFTYRIP
jgi:hypothetical protein